MKSPVIVAVALLGLSAASAVAQITDSGEHGEPSPDGQIPPHFRGQVTWRGSYRGEIAFNGGGYRYGGRGQQIGGDYVVTLEMNGDTVRGDLKTTGTLGSVGLSGTRDGTICHLVASDGSRSDAYCARRTFRQHMDAENAQGQRITFDAEARVVHVANHVTEERTRAAAAAKAADAAAAAKVAADAAAAVETARIAAMKPATPAQTRALEKAVAADSGAWSSNQYRAGSVRDVRIASDSDGIVVVHGTFDYQDGRTRWVEAQTSKGIVMCLHFWDVGGCEPVRKAVPQSEGLKAAGNPAGAANGSRLRPPPLPKHIDFDHLTIYEIATIAGEKMTNGQVDNLNADDMKRLVAKAEATIDQVTRDSDFRLLQDRETLSLPADLKAVNRAVGQLELALAIRKKLNNSLGPRSMYDVIYGDLNVGWNERDKLDGTTGALSAQWMNDREADRDRCLRQNQLENTGNWCW